MTERILVIKLSALGDFLVAQPSMEAIRRHHPDAHVTLLTTRPFVDMAQRSRYFDAIEVDTRPPAYQWPSWWRLYRFFNKGRFDRVYDLQLNGRTGLYYRLFHKKPEWSGIAKGASHFYANPDWRQMHAAERHRVMLAEMGIKVDAPDFSWMQSDVSLFALKKPYILFAPGAAPQHPEKRWPAGKFGAAAIRFMREGYDIAVLGTSLESRIAAEILHICPEAHDLTGMTSFYDIATLARHAAGAVGNDTGPMHLIAMSGCPALVLFSGTTDPALSAPEGAIAIQAENIADINLSDVMDNFCPRAAA